MAQALPELIRRKGFVPQPVFTNMETLKPTAKNDLTTVRCDENNDCIITLLEQVSECLNSEFSFSYDSENEDETQADEVNTDDDMPNAPPNTPR